MIFEMSKCYHVSYFSSCCDKISDKSNLRRGLFVLHLGRAVYHSQCHIGSKTGGIEIHAAVHSFSPCYAVQNPNPGEAATRI